MKRIQTQQAQQEQTAHKEGMYLERSVRNLKAQIRSSSKKALKYLNESCLSNGKIFCVRKLVLPPNLHKSVV